jgi:tetratricopeptide (TPR) repeat protein
MDREEVSSVPEVTDEERRANRRQLTQQAITLAVQSRWQEAADMNRQIVELAPDDAETYNRLGKAYTELGRIADARQAYESTLRVDPANLIAQRNLDRLSRIDEKEAAEQLARKGSQKLDPRFFIEETGKTGVVTVQNSSGPAAIATLTAGDEVKLEPRDNQLLATTMDGTYLGRMDDQLAQRIMRLMQTGNRYQAGVIGVDDPDVRMMIRETFQAPENAGRISFPPRGKQEGLPRPYLREGLLRRAADEEDEDDLDVDLDADVDEDDEEDASEFGFHEASLDEA